MNDPIGDAHVAILSLASLTDSFRYFDSRFSIYQSFIHTWVIDCWILIFSSILNFWHIIDLRCPMIYQSLVIDRLFFDNIAIRLYSDFYRWLRASNTIIFDISVVNSRWFIFRYIYCSFVWNLNFSTYIHTIFAMLILSRDYAFWIFLIVNFRYIDYQFPMSWFFVITRTFDVMCFRSSTRAVSSNASCL